MRAILSPVLKALSPFIFLLSPFLFYQCSGDNQTQTEDGAEAASSADTTVQTPTLVQLWETDTVLTTCESVLYDKDSDRIFVANIVGDPTGKNGDGTIAIISKSGEVENVNWASGLNAPKGMAILNDHLYVTDIDELVAINLEDGSIANRYPVKNAVFLNDAASNGETIYFSDNRDGKVYFLEDEAVQILIEGQENINGLQFDDAGELYGLDAKGLRKYPLDGAEPEMVNDKIIGGDGLIILDDGSFIASVWKGEIYYADSDSTHQMLDTTEQESNTADIGYIPDEQMLLVPTFYKNKVVAYKFER